MVLQTHLTEKVTVSHEIPVDVESTRAGKHRNAHWSVNAERGLDDEGLAL